jgi:hypothetical protein
MDTKNLVGLVLEKGDTIIYIHSIKPQEDVFALDFTDLITGERRTEIPTTTFFKDYKEVSDKSLSTKGLYEKVYSLRHPC